MRPRELDALPFVSVRGVVYVERVALEAALKAEAEAAKAETATERVLPRPAPKDVPS